MDIREFPTVAQASAPSAGPTLPERLPEQVTPVTAGLLAWWFGRPGRPGPSERRTSDFTGAQRRVLLDIVRACETPDAAGGSGRAGAAVSGAAPHHRLLLPAGADALPVLLAILAWQWLNKTAALAEGRDDARFARHFLVLTPGPAAYERLRDALAGRSAGAVRRIDLLSPPVHRDAVAAFLHDRVRLLESDDAGEPDHRGTIALADGRAWARGDARAQASDDSGWPPGIRRYLRDRHRARRREALEFLAALPELLVLDDRTDIHDPLGAEGPAAGGPSQECLARIAAVPGRRVVRLDSLAAPHDAMAKLPPLPALRGAPGVRPDAPRDPGAAAGAPQDLLRTVRFSDPPLDDAMLDLAGYNEQLAHLAHRVAQALRDRGGPDSPEAGASAHTLLPWGPVDVMGWLDRYVWTRLLGAAVDPLERIDGVPRWHLLRSPPVADHIVAVFAELLRPPA